MKPNLKGQQWDLVETNVLKKGWVTLKIHRNYSPWLIKINQWPAITDPVGVARINSPIALKREPMILRTKTVACVPGGLEWECRAGRQHKGHIWDHCVVKKHSGDVEISTHKKKKNRRPEYYSKHPCEYSIFDWLSVYPLQMSLKRHEDVTADSGITLDPSQMG